MIEPVHRMQLGYSTDFDCDEENVLHAVRFSRQLFSRQEIEAWLDAENLKYKPSDLRAEESHWIFTWNPARHFQRGSFRTVEHSRGIYAIVGCPKVRRRPSRDKRRSSL